MTEPEKKPHRDSLFVEEAAVLLHDAWPGDQYILRVQAPKCAAHAQPGHFAHIQCGPGLPMRRPLSIMRAHPGAGWVEFLYKDVGVGTHELSNRRIGENVNLIGPIGTGFSPDPARPRTLLLGGGVGIPPMVFLSDVLRKDSQWQPVVFMGSEVPFPFKPQPSRFLLPGMPEGTIAAMPLLEDWDIPGRLASLQDYPGCFPGYITDLARCWLDAMDEDGRALVSLFACGPHPMLAATAALAQEYGIPCQVSLEEYMACAVGGCAGCTVAVNTPQGPAMKRVCVDGPVFSSDAVVW